ncbi:hypothetical protein [Paraburkholderia tagetis]|uniref:Uncharacterized protein n=1 Tax=Paraburkholderia tagetis TaxID=2913261 RepID=A0A9X1RNI9_9BURK|nr:hypothetical protein [Paraburkholderia tagetis]MCG5073032.1 hypothetical protein [Paraburkholderia tagetis]
MAGISICEFARRDGCSDGAVRKAIKAGLIAALPFGGSPLAFEPAPLFNGLPEEERALAAWLAGQS